VSETLVTRECVRSANEATVRRVGGRTTDASTDASTVLRTLDAFLAFVLPSSFGDETKLTVYGWTMTKLSLFDVARRLSAVTSCNDTTTRADNLGQLTTDRTVSQPSNKSPNAIYLGY